VPSVKVDIIKPWTVLYPKNLNITFLSDQKIKFQSKLPSDPRQSLEGK